jgi:hypothetical protein
MPSVGFLFLEHARAIRGSAAKASAAPLDEPSRCGTKVYERFR